MQQQLVNTLHADLRRNNKDLKSVYLYPQIGIDGTYSPKSKYSLFWNINASHKEYTEVDNYDVSQANLNLGANYKINSLYILHGGFYYQEYLVDGKRYHEAPIVTLSVNRLLNANNIFKIYTNDGVLVYPQNRLLGVNMYVGGLEWLYFSSRNMLVTRVFSGRNQPRGGGAKYNGSNYFGAVISAKHQVLHKVNLTAGVTYQNALYDEKEFVGASRRRDLYGKISAGIDYRFHPNYTWYLLSSYINNHSNVFPYKYKRFDTLTGINFEF